MHCETVRFSFKCLSDCVDWERKSSLNMCGRWWLLELGTCPKRKMTHQTADMKSEESLRWQVATFHPKYVLRSGWQRTCPSLWQEKAGGARNSSRFIFKAAPRQGIVYTVFEYLSSVTFWQFFIFLHFLKNWSDFWKVSAWRRPVRCGAKSTVREISGCCLPCRPLPNRAAKNGCKWNTATSWWNRPLVLSLFQVFYCSCPSRFVGHISFFFLILCIFLLFFVRLFFHFSHPKKCFRADGVQMDRPRECRWGAKGKRGKRKRCRGRRTLAARWCFQNRLGPPIVTILCRLHVVLWKNTKRVLFVLIRVFLKRAIPAHKWADHEQNKIQGAKKTHIQKRNRNTSEVQKNIGCHVLKSTAWWSECGTEGSDDHVTLWQTCLDAMPREMKIRALCVWTMMFHWWKNTSVTVRNNALQHRWCELWKAR